MINADRVEAKTQVDATFPSGDATAAFLEQVRLWNAVAGLPRIQTRSAADGGRIVLTSVVSARRGMVRLVEAFGGTLVGS